MRIPKSITIGSKLYAIQQPPTLGQCQKGFIQYDRQTIKVARYSAVTLARYSAKSRAETFWHEVTHGILHDMGHALYRDEKFVTDFSSRLSRAVDSAVL